MWKQAKIKHQAINSRDAQTFLETDRIDFERVTQLVPDRTRKRFVVIFDAKTGGNICEDQKSLHHILMWFLLEV